MQSQAAELPFYVGKSDIYAYEIPGAGDFWFQMPYFNPSSVDIWPEWELSGGAIWVLPDFSFGNECYGRGVADLGRTVPIPSLRPGEDVTVMSRPDIEWIISVWETDPSLRSPGIRHEYPIPPGEGDPDNGCTVRALQVANEAACILTLPRWYAEPFSTPRVV